MGYIGSPVRRLIITLIKLYQLVLSPYFGPCCRYDPSCSNYAIDAINHYGAMRGFWYLLKRIVRCHPWARGGYDPIPPFNLISNLTRNNEK